MTITVREIRTSKEKRDFIYLPEKIHKDHALWVPPIYADDKKTFDPRTNMAYAYCDSVCALAYQGGTPVGRITGIINRRYNDQWKKKNARFGYLECLESEEVAHALLSFVEQFARSKGMEKIVGPMGFTEEDPEGYRIEGFEYPPNLSTYCNSEYLPRLLEHEGYAKEVDYVVYKADLAGAISDFYRNAYERVKKNREFKLVEFSGRKQIRAYIRPIFTLMNECFKGIYGYSSLEEKEMDRLAERYLPVVDPRFIKLVENSRGELIGFILGIPSIADGIRKAKGRVYPFGVLKILRAMRKSTKLDLYLGGIKEAYRGKGVDVLLGYSIIESAKNAGFEYMDSHHELETNVMMRSEMERIGGKVYKRYRIYQKSLV